MRRAILLGLFSASLCNGVAVTARAQVKAPALTLPNQWYLFTAFVGVNLFQSAFTNWCPMMMFLRKLGVRA